MSDNGVRQGKIDELIPDRKNANKGTQVGLRALDRSLRELGMGRSVLTDKKGEIIAGNKTTLQAADIGIDDVIIVPTDGTKLIVVERTDLDLDTDDEARQLAYADNRIAELDLEWDYEQIDFDIDEGIDLEWLGFGFEQEPDPGAQIDRAEELREKWGVETGQLWRLGEHRLICGDCTDGAIVDRLMQGEKAGAVVTDPPYGIEIVGKSGTAGNFPGTNAPRLQAEPIIGDDKPFDPAHLFDLADNLILWGANHYADKLPACAKWLVWDKKDGAFEGSDLGDCELAWTNLGGASRLLHHTWQGMYRKGEGERDARQHPTQKPVALFEWCIEQTKILGGAIVIDPYVGSGSSLIACERLGRKCRAVEISPAYCAVAIQRWVDMTSGEPELVK